MYYLATTTLFISVFYKHFSSHSMTYSSLNRLVFSLLPTHSPLLFPIESGFDCTMEEKKKSATLYFSTIRNGCVLPLFVHLGATLPCFRGLTVPTGLEDHKGNVGLGTVR